jgi:hypothetical protein
VINQVCFYGDFFGQRDVSELANTLRGTLYEPSALQKVLDGVRVGDYF